MAKAKQGDLYSCMECGLIIVVDQGSQCEATEIICCKQPMAKGKLAANKARKMAPALAVPKKTVTKKATKATAKPKAKPKAKTKTAPVPKVKKAVKKTQKRTKKV
ncbi:MAG: hypothetical protein JW950_11650 [Deltaproteobacteria bacterium]|nr:hypothetical protein [Deltaproteobacteria bacterium]